MEPTSQLEYIETLRAEQAAPAAPPTGASGAADPLEPPTTEPRPMPTSRRPLAVAALATLALVAALVLAVWRAADRDPVAAAGPAPATAPTDDVAGTYPDPVPADAADAAVEPIPPVPWPAPDAADGPAEEGVGAPAAVPAPTVPVTTDPPPAPPPAPAAQLVAQGDHQLDPGADEVTITLQNQGDATLQFEIANDGDGFVAATPTGDIVAGGTADVVIEIDVEPDGVGPTPFHRTVEVTSNGGDLAIGIDGQVEKPGHLVAELESLPFVDYRATVTFTNVGGLPLAITGIEAPGLRFAPLPDAIAAGESLAIEVAICAGDPPLPVLIPHVQPPLPVPRFQLVSWVTLETDANAASTQLAGWTVGFAPPSCQPVVPSLGDLAVAPGP